MCRTGSCIRNPCRLESHELPATDTDRAFASANPPTFILDQPAISRFPFHLSCKFRIGSSLPSSQTTIHTIHDPRLPVLYHHLSSSTEKSCTPAESYSCGLDASKRPSIQSSYSITAELCRPQK